MKIKEKIQKLQVRIASDTARREMLINGELNATPKEKEEAIKQELNSLNSVIVKYEEYLNNNKKVIEEKKAEGQGITDLIRKKESLKNEKYSKLQKAKATLETLQNMKNNKTDLANGTKHIVENTHLFPGFKSIVSNLINVEDKYARAIETVLNSALQHIVVDKPETAVKAINFLKDNHAGRATFIPLSSITPRYINEQHKVVAQTQKGFLGVASDLVKMEAEFSVLNKFLLGNILVTDTIESASRLSQLLEKRYLIVSLDGDLVRVGGVMSGGQATERPSVLKLDTQIKSIEDTIPNLEKEVNELSLELRDLNSKRDFIISSSGSLQVESSKTQGKLDIVKDKFLDLKNKLEEITDAEFETQTVKNAAVEIQELELENSNLTVEKNSIADSLMQARNENQDETRKLMDLTSQQNNYLSENGIILKNIAKAESVINLTKQRLSEQYNMLIESAQKVYNPEIDFEVARKLVNSLKEDIKELGHVDLNSINDFEEVQKRYEQIESQQNEIIEAKKTIEEAIENLDQIIIERITNTVSLVNAEFKHVFSKMFGGGMAEIRFTEPDNILESGIDVVAQPPGKSVRNLKLFSGGEKALIAISLLFSILKAKPLPLCILDEVEAALDEANVIRFAEFLQVLKADTQFLVITHRQGTMERVDKLYGATMQKRGVTTFFAVNLSEAKELVDEHGNAKN
ncbi:hypothetical protein [Mycoplasma struthionis]|uniref:hypothetical protein n=1 Tax=Mycoplasma struthionis TaxID=538220 RepID=UPI0021BD1564|nr:hypothetical protein [Mycoplasma struthionis]